MQNADTQKTGWSIIGPGGGGATFLPTINPHDNRNVITVCDMTGAYITCDGGERWREFNLKTRVDAVAFDPLDGDTIYAGSSGLFRSRDRGRTWRLVFPDPEKVTGEELLGDEAGHRYLSSDNWPGGEIRGIAVDPLDTRCLSICMFQRYGNRRFALYRSADAGATWAYAADAGGERLHKLVIDASNPSNKRLYVFTDTEIVELCSDGNNIYRIALPDGARSILDADYGMNPGAGGAPVFFILTPASWEGGKFRPGVYRSADRGATWRALGGGLDDDLHGPDNGQSRVFRNIAAVGADCRTVWVDVWREPFEFFDNPRPEMNYFGIMKSEDMGDTWSWSMKGGALFPENLEGGWQERGYSTDWYGGPLDMAASPNDPNVCWFTGFMGNYRTLDGGKTWRQNYSVEYPDFTSSTRGIDVTTCYGVHFDPFDDGHLAISYTDIGLHHSHDGGRTWKHALVGIPRKCINTCYWLAFDPDVKDRVWSVWAGAHDLPRFKMFRTHYFERSAGCVCVSADGMETWEPSPGLPENCSPVHIVLDPKSPAGSRTLYVACMGRGVYKSTDGGETWALKNAGLSGNLNAWRLALLPDGTLYLLVFSGYRDGMIEAGQIFVSPDGAESWRELPMPEDANAPSDIAFDPSDPRRMYLSCWPRSGADPGPRGGLFRTEDGGHTWKRIYPSDAYAYAVAVHPIHTDTVFFAAFDGAVRRSDDRGKTWRRIRGYNFKWGHRPVVDVHDTDTLYVTTFGSSVWHGPAAGDDAAAEDIVG